MTRSTQNNPALPVLNPVGVGLRHGHFNEALQGVFEVNFFEVHAENFFADGGLARQILVDIAEQTPISLHGTAMGLGSAAGVDRAYLARLRALVDDIQPVLISDHASFAWAEISGRKVHMGDLLPIPFNEQSLVVLVDNVDRVQQVLGRRLLVENLVAYMDLAGSTMSETAFFSRLVERTGCGLLIDLNNLLVNAKNQGSTAPLAVAQQWLTEIPAAAVAELHLAGYTPPLPGQLIIDDHSQPVSPECWQLYTFAIERFDSFATLVEWDNQLPGWNVLNDEAVHARRILNARQQQEVKHEQRNTCYQRRSA